MDLREYLEEDMSEFLDIHLSKEHLADRADSNSVRVEETAALILGDYEAELFYALKQHDVVRAKQVLHEVKDAFDSYPVGSNERKQLQSLLHSLYTKFRQFLEDENTFNKFEDALGEVDAPDKAAKMMDAPRTIPSLVNEPKNPELQDSLTEKEEEEKLSSAASAVAEMRAEQGETELEAHADMEAAANEFLQHLAALQKALAAEDVHLAHHHYTHAKKIYDMLPPKHKRKHHDTLVARHQQVLALMNKKAQAPGNALERFEVEIQAALEHKHLHEAMQLYEQLRNEVTKLSERGDWPQKLSSLYEKIMAAWEEQKQMKKAVPDESFPKSGSELLEHHERKLTGKP